MAIGTIIIVYLVLVLIFFGGIKFFTWLREKRKEQQEEVGLPK